MVKDIRISCVEIDAGHVVAGDIVAIEDRETRGLAGCKRVLKIAESIKQVSGVVKLVVRLSHQARLVKRRGKVAGVLLERSAH